MIKKKVPASQSGQVNFMDAEQILQQEPVMAGMFTIDSHPAHVLFDSDDGVCSEAQYISFGYSYCL